MLYIADDADDFGISTQYLLCLTFPRLMFRRAIQPDQCTEAAMAKGDISVTYREAAYGKCPPAEPTCPLSDTNKLGAAAEFRYWRRACEGDPTQASRCLAKPIL